MKTPSLKRTAAAVIGAVVLAGAGLGVVNAQQAPAPVSSSPAVAQTKRAQFASALAHRLNISSAQLQQAISSARQDVGLPATPAHGARGILGAAGRRPARLRGTFKSIATLFGETPQQLRAELPANSLADLASQHNQTVNEVVSALTNAINQRIDHAVSTGRIAPARADQLKSRVGQRAERIVNHKFPMASGQPGRQANPQGTAQP
jgi:hypothetical protein